MWIGIGVFAVEAMAYLQEDGQRAVTRQYSALTRSLLEEVNPSIIVIPLFGSGFDGGQAVQRLHSLGFAGELRILCPQLPNPGMVLKELNLMAPEIQIELICMPAR